MKRNKKWSLLALAMAMAMLLVFAGCNRDDNGSSGEESNPSDAVSDVDYTDGEDVADQVFLIEEIDKAIERNQDTVGWIRIPGTTVDDAVLQAKDNDYYLRLNEDKKYDIYGCYFADYGSKLGGGREGLSKNTIIYGHSDLKDNKDGKKFSQLFKYTDLEFLKENPYIYFATPESDMVWQVFAVFYTHIKFNYIQPNPSDEEFQKILDEAKSKSEFIIDTPVTTEDNILTLSTCTVNYNPADHDNYRLVVMAKLLPTNEVPATGVNAEVNPNPVKS